MPVTNVVLLGSKSTLQDLLSNDGWDSFKHLFLTASTLEGHWKRKGLFLLVSAAAPLFRGRGKDILRYSAPATGQAFTLGLCALQATTPVPPRPAVAHLCPEGLLSACPAQPNTYIKNKYIYKNKLMSVWSASQKCGQ